MNKLQQDKQKKTLEEEQKQKAKESMWFKHEKEVKERLIIQLQEKEAKEYDSKKAVKDQDFLEAEKQRQLDERRRKAFEVKKKALEDKKSRDMEELQRQKEDEKHRKRKQNEAKLVQQKEFLKLQKQKIEENFTVKINDRKDLVTVQKQVEDQTKHKFDKIKSNMVTYITQTKD